MFARKKMSENVDPLQRGMRAKTVTTRKTTSTVNLGNQIDVPTKPGIPKLKRPVAGQQKRSAFGDLTNATKEKETEGKKAPGLIKPALKTVNAVPKTGVAKAGVVKPSVSKARTASKKTTDVKKKAVLKPQDSNTSVASTTSSLKSSQESNEGEASDSLVQKNIAAGVPIDRQEEDFSFIVAEDFDDWTEENDKAKLLSVDRENYSDVFNIGIFAQDIFDYYKRREKMFQIPDYLKAKSSKITPIMRAILVDWMVEIQENFELNHETLYLAVKLSDLFLAREPQEKEMLQLVGAASVFIASKFDERCPPLIEDFTYICDNSFNREQFIEMEMEILRKIDFDLGIPISYRFLRRYSKVAKTAMPTLTLARYILEMSLMEYSLVTKRDSIIAAAALFIAMKMSKDGVWEGEVVQSSGYTVEDLKEMIVALNTMLHARPISQLNTIRSKYSHVVFHEVAKIKALPLSALL